MAFTEPERVQIRRWLGFSPIFRSTDPLLESGITAVQSLAEGGSLPDNSTELAIRGWLAELATIETRWRVFYNIMHGYKVDEITADPIRGLAGLRQVGRMYVGFIADAIYAPVKRDVFSAPPTAE